MKQRIIAIRLLILLLINFLIYSCAEQSTDSDLVNFQSGTGHSSEVIIESIVKPSAGTYSENGVLGFQVNFSDSVIVNGSPKLLLTIGSESVAIPYTSGSGTPSLNFSYTISSFDDDLDGIEYESLSITGGTITDNQGTNLSSLNFSPVASSLSSIIIDNSSGIIAPDQVSTITTAPTTENTSLEVSWNVPSNNGTSIINYSLQYRKSGVTAWRNLSPSPSINQATITGLETGENYEIRVAANNGIMGVYSSTTEVEIFDILSLSPIAWLSSTNITNGGTEPNNGDLIASWSDLTGQASSAEETNTANQPTYETNVKNGLPAVKFDGTLDRGLEGSFTRNNGTNLTIILVAKMNTNTSRKAFFEFYQTGSPNSGSDSRRGFFFTYGFGVASVNYYLDDTDFNIWVAKDNGTQSSLWENGSEVYTEVSNYFGRTDFMGSGQYVLGDDQTGGDKLNGYIGEFLVFDEDLSDEDLIKITNYLQNKWGI